MANINCQQSFLFMQIMAEDHVLRTFRLYFLIKKGAKCSNKSDFLEKSINNTCYLIRMCGNILK